MPSVPKINWPNKATLPDYEKKQQNDFLIVSVDNSRVKTYMANMANKRKAKK